MKTSEKYLEKYTNPQLIYEAQLPMSFSVIKNYGKLIELETIAEVKRQLLKQLHLMTHNNGYPSEAVAKATILSLNSIMGSSDNELTELTKKLNLE